MESKLPQENVDKYNEAIALFLGYELMSKEEISEWLSVKTVERLERLRRDLWPKYKKVGVIVKANSNDVFYKEQIDVFHEDWNKLMPVVKKLYGKVKTDENYIYYTEIEDGLKNQDINLVFEGIGKICDDIIALKTHEM